MEKLPKYSPNDFNPELGKTSNGRKEIILGTDRDGLRITLPPYIELPGGIQVHPSRLQQYLTNRQEWEKKDGGNSSRS